MQYTLGNRELVLGVALGQEFVKTAFEWKHFIQGCLCYKSVLEPFLNARQSLEKMNVQEGSLYLEDERELVREAKCSKPTR